MSYEDIRDSYSKSNPKYWTTFDGISFKSCPNCDVAPRVGSTCIYEGTKAKELFFVECSKTSHFYRVEGDDLMSVAMNWNNRSYQNQCFSGSQELRVNPFEAIVNDQPKWTSLAESKSAQRLFEGRKEYLIPRQSFFYVDGDYNGGFYIATWGADQVGARNEWNCRLGIYPHFDTPKEKRFFGFGMFLK